AERGRSLEDRGEFLVREVGIEGHVVGRQGDTGAVELAADGLEVVNRRRIEAPLPYRFTPAHSLDSRNRVLRLHMSGPELAMSEPYDPDAGDDVVERPVTEAVALRAEANARDARGLRRGEGFKPRQRRRNDATDDQRIPFPACQPHSCLKNSHEGVKELKTWSSKTSLHCLHSFMCALLYSEYPSRYFRVSKSFGAGVRSSTGVLFVTNIAAPSQCSFLLERSETTPRSMISVR